MLFVNQHYCGGLSRFNVLCDFLSITRVHVFKRKRKEKQNVQRPTGCVLCPSSLLFRGSHICNHERVFVCVCMCCSVCVCVCVYRQTR